MTSYSQRCSKAKALDPDLLSMPFKVQTNWHVITGAPCSGKSTLIEQLAERGYHTIPETGRLFFERELEKGRMADEIRKDMAALQIEIKDKQLKIEHGLQEEDVVFLDGAVPGSMAWYRAFGLDPNEILPDCFHHRYASILVFDPLPFFQRDGARDKDAAIVRYLDEWLARDYIALGYHVVRVPVLSLEERLAFVLKEISQRVRI